MAHWTVSRENTFLTGDQAELGCSDGEAYYTELFVVGIAVEAALFLVFSLHSVIVSSHEVPPAGPAGLNEVDLCGGGTFFIFIFKYFTYFFFFSFLF